MVRVHPGSSDFVERKLEQRGACARLQPPKGGETIRPVSKLDELMDTILIGRVIHSEVVLS